MLRCNYLLAALLLCLLAVSAQAQTGVVINSPEVNLTDFRIGYYVDDSRSLDYAQARQQTYSETSNTASLGTNARVAWYRVELDNQSGEELALNVHLPHAYHVKSVQFYTERDGALVSQEELDLERVDDSNLMFRGAAVYPLLLPADTTTTLYVRSFAYSHQWFALQILDQDHSRRALVGVANDIALLVGMMLALVFYNLLLYFATSKIENIYYSCYLVSGLVWIALSYGLVASLFDAYGQDVFMLNISLITMPIFLMLFMMAVFETRKHYPLEHRALQAVLLPLCGMLVWGFFDISAALKPASSMALVMMIVTISVSISLLRKGNPLARYFLIGHSLFVLFNTLAVIFYKGLIEPTYIASHGVGIGIMLEALMLAFIISHRIKILEGIRASQDELKKQASTDPLTRLHNRRYFAAAADYLLEQCQQQGEPVTALVADIDHFKQVNDTWGHGTGDKVLVTIAQRLKDCCRNRDLIARFGGEEFVVLLPNADPHQAMQCAERMRHAVESARIDAGTEQPLQLTISLGVTAIAPGDSLQDALNRADKALYQAKHSGRNQVCLYQLSASNSDTPSQIHG
ncbi:sensor domain-containing diguanylate cyclase [Halopseudomonas pachastrellae]|uniref:sensor domain-containing diguanylate cyclase n=1 Tax=Halopseudomonas pachastrellae TaxID=254161 RepID=UPI003D7F031A